MDSRTPSGPTANLATRPMRVLWAPNHDAGTWYPIVPVVDALGRAGPQVVVSGPPMVRTMAAAMGLPWQPDGLALARTAFEGRPRGFDDALGRRVQFARAWVGTSGPLLAKDQFEVVLSGPFRYGTGLAAGEAATPRVSYVHHCFPGDEPMDGLFEVSWSGGSIQATSSRNAGLSPTRQVPPRAGPWPRWRPSMNDSRVQIRVTATAPDGPR